MGKDDQEVSKDNAISILNAIEEVMPKKKAAKRVSKKSVKKGDAYQCSACVRSCRDGGRGLRVCGCLRHHLNFEADERLRMQYIFI